MIEIPHFLDRDNKRLNDYINKFPHNKESLWFKSQLKRMENDFCYYKDSIDDLKSSNISKDNTIKTLLRRLRAYKCIVRIIFYICVILIFKEFL